MTLIIGNIMKILTAISIVMLIGTLAFVQTVEASPILNGSTWNGVSSIYDPSGNSFLKNSTFYCGSNMTCTYNANGSVSVASTSGGVSGMSNPATVDLDMNNLSILNLVGTFWLNGTVGNTPTSGAGTRIMWIPNKSAFRVGTVTGTQWDNSNIGNKSFSSGYNSIASGLYSTAMGYGANASNGNSVAIGEYVTSSGSASVAFGYLNVASGSYSTVLGYANIASNYVSTALGYATTASGQYSTSTGSGTTASGDYSYANGRDTTVSGVGSVAYGLDGGTYTESESNVFSLYGGHFKGNGSGLTNINAANLYGTPTSLNYPNTTVASKEATWDAKTTLSTVNSSALLQSIAQVLGLQGLFDGQNTSISNLQANDTVDRAFVNSSNRLDQSINFVISNGTNVIGTGIKGDVEIPFSGTIISSTALADQSGSFNVSWWKDTYANYPPTVADSLGYQAITTATKNQTTGLSQAVTAGDILRFNVESATTVTRVTISLTVRRS